MKSLARRWDRFLRRELNYDFSGKGLTIQGYFTKLTGLPDQHDDPIAVYFYGERAGTLTDINGIIMRGDIRGQNETVREKIFYERYHFIVLMEYFRYNKEKWDFYAHL